MFTPSSSLVRSRSIPALASRSRLYPSLRAHSPLFTMRVLARGHTRAPSARAHTARPRARRVVRRARADATPNDVDANDDVASRSTRSRRALLASVGALAVGALAVTTAEPAMASEARAAPASRAYYFGNGCFWGRQHTFYEAERALGRTDDTITSVVGYAGGAVKQAEDKPVCYYYGAADTVYERLGHCEVVAVEARDERELRTLADAYFGSFQKIPGLGMQRVDPQDSGPGYRNCIALPGGMSSPMFKVIEEANVHNMKLVRGEGNSMKSDRKPTETDVINQVWIYDSDVLPFYPAEVYHQFHDGLGYKFPQEYTRGVKANALERGLIAPTGCPEMRERSFADFVSAMT